MWLRRRPVDAAPAPAEAPPQSLRDALRQARIKMAEQSAVVVDLRDAELARLELLNEALDPLFNDVPAEIDLFDRGISHGETPRLWIDAITHVNMGRDKRQYRLVQDTRYGRKVLADSTDIKDMVEAVTHYIASRLVERERALAAADGPAGDQLRRDMRIVWRGRRWHMMRAFLFGLIMGGLALFGALWIVASRLAH